MLDPAGAHTGGAGAAIAEWAAIAPPRLRARLGLGGTVPDLVTIWRVLTAVDPAALECALGAWVALRTGGSGT